MILKLSMCEQGCPAIPVATHFNVNHRAPMKALASEIVRKFGKRLQWLSIKVRELTGESKEYSLIYRHSNQYL